MRCKICESASAPFGRTTVRGKYRAEYYVCSKCGFMQAADPIWLAEAYESAIDDLDIGTVSRAISNARITKVVIDTFFNPAARFIDYGGGYGVFTRRMRDLGYDFFLYDKYCQNLFAKNFAADVTRGVLYDLMTSYEVFEHLPEPLVEIESLLGVSRNIIFTTELLPSPTPGIGTWWYYGVEHGQHVSFYTRRSLSHIAGRFGLHLCSNGVNLHLLTSKPVPEKWFRFVTKPVIRASLELLRPRRTLLVSDFERAQAISKSSRVRREPAIT